MRKVAVIASASGNGKTTFGRELARRLDVEFVEVNLSKDPVGRMRELYNHFNLGGFDAYRPRLEQYLASIKGYETNRYQLSAEQKAEISAGRHIARAHFHEFSGQLWP